MFPAQIRRLCNVLAVTAGLALAGCLSPNTLDDRAFSDGVTRDFEAPFARASAAVDTALRASALRVRSARREDSRMIFAFDRPIDEESWGEIGRVVVIPSGESASRITVTLENRYRLQPHRITEAEFAAAFFGDVDAALSGQ